MSESKEEEEAAQALQELFHACAADLLSIARFEPFVRRLFQSPPGVWQPVADLCAGMEELPDNTTELLADEGERFVTTHLPWPEPTALGYATVLFLHTDTLWSFAAAYNRGRLMD